MKMVKSLLLGSAAGLVAIASAQAADLPVKAKPVQYVKICSLYGAGFYYIPGTDICLKIGGWVRFEAGYGTNGSFTNGPFVAGLNDRTTSNSAWRSRGYITADARNQTEYGTVRSYIAVGVSGNDVGAGTMDFSSNRAFIQWAGFTFGHATSFFDFFNPSATGYYGFIPGGDTGDGGWKVAGYTAQFGNGFSATIAAEMTARSVVLNTTGAFTNFYTPAAANLAGYGGYDAPDVVANLRVDQAWGSAQLMGALHEVHPAYYTAVEGSGHPSDKMGWAVGAGVKINFPMIGRGDYLQAGVIYAEGATRYTNRAIGTQQLSNFDGANLAYGLTSDAVYGAGGDLELTKSWSVAAAYEHFWNTRWKTSLWGAYGSIDYSSNANALLCAAQGQAVATCDNDWRQWHIGSRTQWNITKDFYMGLEVLYSKLDSASVPATFVATNGSKGAGVYTTGDQDNVALRFRVHRDFMP